MILRPSPPLDQFSTTYRNYADIPIIITFGKDTLHKDSLKEYALNGDTGTLAPFEVSILEINPGFLWTPIIKRSKFIANGACYFNGAVFFPRRKIKKIDSIMLEGQFQIKGTISVKGICSHASAVQKIKDFVISDIRRQIKQKRVSLNQYALNFVPEENL